MSTKYLVFRDIILENLDYDILLNQKLLIANVLSLSSSDQRANSVQEQRTLYSRFHLYRHSKSDNKFGQSVVSIRISSHPDYNIAGRYHSGCYDINS